MHDDFLILNIREYLRQGQSGEEVLQQVFSTFCCNKNPDVERFLLEQSINSSINDLKNRNRNLKIQYIIDEPGDFYNINDSLYGIAIRHNLIKYNYVKYYINKGLKVYAWTINDIETYEKVFKESREFSNKINYITDYPNILCRYDIKKFIKI